MTTVKQHSAAGRSSRSSRSRGDRTKTKRAKALMYRSHRTRCCSSSERHRRRHCAVNKPPPGRSTPSGGACSLLGTAQEARAHPLSMSRPSVGLVLSQPADGSGSHKRQKLSLFDSQPARPRPLIPLHDDGSTNNSTVSASSAAALLADKAARGELDPLDAFMAAMGRAAAGPHAAAALPSLQPPSDVEQAQRQPQPLAAASPAGESGSAEEDPLDAFMKTLAPAATASSSQPASSQPVKARRYDDYGEELTAEGEDSEDLYALLGRRDDEDEDDDQDDALSASPSSDDEDGGDSGGADGSVVKRGKHIAALPPLDHSAIAYPSLPAPSYTPHPSLVPPLSPSVLAQLTAFASISTAPPHVTPPVPSFCHAASASCAAVLPLVPVLHHSYSHTGAGRPSRPARTRSDLPGSHRLGQSQRVTQHATSTRSSRSQR